MKLDTKDLMFTRASSVWEATLTEDTPERRREAVNEHITQLKQSQLILVDPCTLTASINEEEDITLPFRSCFFESSVKGESFMTLHDDKKEIDVFGLFAQERVPGEIAGLLYRRADNGLLAQQFLVGAFYDTELSKLEPLMRSLLALICSSIHKCNLGTERVFRTVNLRTRTQGKCLHKIENVIRLKPILHKSYPEPAFSREIDWNMRWWVRGHWRKLPGPEVPGKDRTGEYNVKGFTWVTEHLRGPEDKPIRRSTYILGDINATERHQTI